VAGIERLIKRSIEIKPVDVARRPSRDDRAPRGGDRQPVRDREAARGQRFAPAPALRSAPTDDFFSRPYEPAVDAGTADKEDSDEAPTQNGKKPAKVATLLGGGGKR
jgi:hypothetical protein